MDVQTTSQPPRLDLAAPLQQHHLYGKVIEKLGGKHCWFTASVAGEPVAQAQVLVRKLGACVLWWLPRGPILLPGHDIHRATALSALTNAPPGLVLSVPESVEDEACLDRSRQWALMSPQWVAELDLRLSERDRLINQHGKWRKRLRKAQSEAMQITERAFDLARDKPLLELERNQRIRNRYTALPLRFTQFWATLAPETARLYTAHRKGKLLAFALFLIHGCVATYHIGWTGPLGRRLSAHTQLIWEASNSLANQGCVRLDLGHVDTENTPGLARFKIGSGAHIRPLGPTLLRLPRLFRTKAQTRGAFPLANPSAPS